LGDKPAEHFGLSHTVFGDLDADSIKVAESIVQLPSHTPGGPNTMRFLKEYLEFDMAPAHAPRAKNA
jgi:hypothetical protein